MPTVAILGGGLSGLYLGRRLKEKGVAFRILEAADGVGGLCRTVRRGEHSWDLGPHAFYSKNPAAMAYYRALPLEYASLRRDVKICHRSAAGIHEVAYPFENGLADLPLKERWECVWGYLRAARTRPREGFRNLQQWIDRGLGRGIARYFMKPYNEKIWNHPLDGISMALVSGKIDPETPWRVIRQALFRGSVGRVYQAQFIYPTQGAGAIPDVIAAGVKDRIATGWRVSRIRPAAGGWRIHSERGEELTACGIVSTIPVPALLQALDDPELSRYRAAFVSNDTYFVAIGLKPRRSFARFSRCHWVFFPGGEAFYRVTFMQNFSVMRPATLVAEITDKGIASAPSLGALVLRDLAANGIIENEADVEFVDVRLEKNTYPIPTLGFAAARREIEAMLKKKKMFLLGRNGRWDYINTDGVFMAVEAFMQTRLRELGGR